MHKRRKEDRLVPGPTYKLADGGPVRVKVRALHEQARLEVPFVVPSLHQISFEGP